ncbi:MAG: flagellar biosynthetic protein FliR, partial [Halocynthiibacter sp.]
FLGTLALILMAALQTAGTVIAYVSSMANAFIQDPIAQQQSSLISGFLSTLGLLLVFITDMHHLMIRGIGESYRGSLGSRSYCAGTNYCTVAQIPTSQMARAIR